jgi:TRAP-type C4-dicarboxylate transport system permease small subunit
VRKLLDRAYVAAAYVAACCVLAIMLLMIAQSLMRGLQMRTGAVNDIVSWLCAAASFFAMAHAFKQGDFVRVTLVLEKLRAPVRRRFELGALAIALAATAYLAYWANRFTYDSWVYEEVAQGLLPLPIWIPQATFALGSILLLVAVIDEFVIVLRGRRPTYVVAVEERHAHGDFSADI